MRVFRRGRDLRCQQAVELMTYYLDNALPAARSSRLEAHLAHCRPCMQYLAQIRAASAAIRQLWADTVQPADRRNLLGLYRRTIG